MRWLAIVSIVVRVVFALILVFGPWADEPGELSGWDVARFQEIADAPGRHWVDHEVEYPPGSVLIIETLAGDDVVGTHRSVVVLSLAVDLAVAAMVSMLGGRRAGAWYLVLGLPLVPMGLLRLDLWSVALAVLAVAAVTQRRTAGFAVLATAAAMVKVWPAVLVAAAFAALPKRASRASTAATVAVMAAGGLAWLAYGGWSLDPIEQVLSLRGATGWHVESVGGTLTSLFTDEQPRAQLNAYRIGESNPGLVLAGRVLTVGVVAALVFLGRRVADTDTEGPTLDVVALVMLGSTAALIVTAPLVSPQFLLWLTPWASLLTRSTSLRPVVGLTALATATTGFVLTLYGPPRLGETIPALVLLGRNLLLVAIAATSILAMARWGSDRAKHPLGNGGPSPHPARSDA